MLAAMKWPARDKPRALVELLAEGISCNLHVRSVDVRGMTATYELIVANRSSVDVSCRLYGIDGGSQTREFGMVTVGRRSAGGSFFSVPLEADRERRIYVEVIGEGINLFAEAIQPAARRKARWLGLVAFWTLSMAAVWGVSMYALEKPTILAFSVTPATSHGRFVASYDVGGRADATFAARMADGTVFASGSLAQKGVISIPVPTRAAGHVVSFALEASGPFGIARRSAMVGVGGSDIVARENTQAGKPLPQSASLVPTTHRVAALPIAKRSALLSTGRVVAGKPFRVAIQSDVPGLHVALKDSAAALVSEVAVPLNAGGVTLLAPASPTEETYTLTTTVDGRPNLASALRLAVYPH